MFEDETKRTWLRIGAIAIITFIVTFLAFYCAMQVMMSKMTDPIYNAHRMEKILKQQERDFKRLENKLMDNPFVPTMRPMLVNLVKENNEYKVIVDLKPLDGDDRGIDVKLSDNVITISGEMESSTNNGEHITNFSQSYYLDETLKTDKISKERIDDKYIITIPFEE